MWINLAAHLVLNVHDWKVGRTIWHGFQIALEDTLALHLFPKSKKF